MPRYRPCASCGRQIHYNPARGGAEQPTCRSCRRKAKTRPCAQCGEPFYSPTSTRFCLQHRKQNPGPASALTCEWCGREYKRGRTKTDPDGQRGRGKKFCSYECRDLARREVSGTWPRSLIWHVICTGCGILFITRRQGTKRCQTCRLTSWYHTLSDSERATHSKRASESIMRRYLSDPSFRDEVISKAQNRRVSKLGLDGITEPRRLLTWLYERDQGICGICGEEVPEGEKGPRRPSIDHIVPLSKGGLHVPANIQLAHLRCNLSKHATMPESWIVDAVRAAGGMSTR